MRSYYRTFTILGQLLLLAVLTANTVMAQADFWESTNGPFRGTIQSIAINSSDDIFVGSYGWGVYRSTDNGDTWSQFTTGLPVGVNPMQTRGGVRALAINSNGDIFAGTDYGGGVFRSRDNGNTWSEINSGIDCIETSEGCIYTRIYVLAINSDDDIFAGTDYGSGMFRSTDNGDNWTQINGLSTSSIGAIAINSNDVIFAVSSIGFFDATVLRSSDNGDTWSESSTGLPGFGCCGLVVNSRNDIFAGARSGTLNNVPFFGRAFVSRDNGDNWMEISSGLDSVDITNLAVNSKDIIFAGLGEGFVIRSVESTTSVEEISTTIPSPFRLEQNYPNPFNPTTTIIYSLSVGTKVKLTIYNLNGQKVITLVNKEHQPGTYLVQWDGKDESGSIVASGIYTYRLAAPERSETRKLVLIR